MCDGPMEIAEKYIKIKNLVHAWLDFVTKLHKYTSFAKSAKSETLLYSAGTKYVKIRTYYKA